MDWMVLNKNGNVFVTVCDLFAMSLKEQRAERKYIALLDEGRKGCLQDCMEGRINDSNVGRKEER